MNTAERPQFHPTSMKGESKENFAKSASDRHKNNFNFLRLLFATLVLLTHSFELASKDEILLKIFGTVSFGDLAVNGFFLLSGFLIVQSWDRNPNLVDFFQKRVLRIYPAFVVASFISALVVGPLGANTIEYFSQFQWAAFLKGVVLLKLPVTPPVFQGQPYPVVNGSMWTIVYEFRCYLLVALLGMCGAIRRRELWLILWGLAFLLYLNPVIVDRINIGKLQLFIGHTPSMIRFIAFFFAGGCFYLFRDYIAYKTNWALVAAVLLIPCLFKIELARFALVLLGGYSLFWFAQVQIASLSSFRTSSDISYGMYLYGWPIQKLLIWFLPGIAPLLVFLMTCVLSAVCGWLSWQLIERPFIQLAKRGKPKPISAAT